MRIKQAEGKEMITGTDHAPVRIGQEVTVGIKDYAHQGEGVGNYRGFTVFVPGALDGEEVIAHIELVKKNYARGSMVKILKPSPHRVDPACRLYGKCGGCQLLHLDYQAQLEFKKQRVLAALERLGGFKDAPVRPMIGMAHPWEYRNKVQYPFALENGRVIVGCYQQGTHNVIDTSECLIQHKLNNKIMNTARELVEGMGLSIYNESTGQGFFRHILVKNGFQSGRAMVVLVTNGEEFPEGKELARVLAGRCPEIQSVVQNINTIKGNVILGERNVVLFGDDGIIDRLGDLEFKISATSFFQVNPAQMEILYEKAVEYAGLTGKERVVDAYCGVGSLTLFLARRARGVYGVEVVNGAVSDAEENAERNKIENVRFVAGETEEVLPRLARIGIDFDVAVMDPPRSGCRKEVLNTLAGLKTGRIVYVSCNPSTLARDLRILVDRGYQIKEIQPVDMFPHTFHIECVVLITRNGSPGKPWKY